MIMKYRSTRKENNWQEGFNYSAQRLLTISRLLLKLSRLLLDDRVITSLGMIFFPLLSAKRYCERTEMLIPSKKKKVSSKKKAGPINRLLL